MSWIDSPNIATRTRLAQSKKQVLTICSILKKFHMYVLPFYLEYLDCTVIILVIS